MGFSYRSNEDWFVNLNRFKNFISKVIKFVVILFKINNIYKNFFNSLKNDYEE